MKKTKTALLAFLALVVCLAGILCFAACGGKEGTYKFYSMTVTTLTGSKQEYKAGDTYEIPLLGSFKLDKDSYTIELKKDGTVAVSSKFGEESVQTGTWKADEEDSGKIEMTIGGVKTTAKCDGSSLVFTSMGSEYTLKK